jgi:hypothetical protein
MGLPPILGRLTNYANAVPGCSVAARAFLEGGESVKLAGFGYSPSTFSKPDVQCLTWAANMASVTDWVRAINVAGLSLGMAKLA